MSAQDSGTDEYVTGMTVVGTPGAGPSCPLIVWFVEPDTPAAKTAIQPGDRVLAIDGHRGIDAAEAHPLLHSKNSNPVKLELEGEHGTYTKSSAHYGDAIISVDGVSPQGKSVPELETLLSSSGPKAMTLVINRDGVTKTFTFDLIKAARLMRQNKKRWYEGKIIPSVIPNAYLHCFESKH